MITTTRIDAADLERLRILAKANRRSMTQELGALLDQATRFDQLSAKERMAEMNLPEIPDSWKPDIAPETWQGPTPEELHEAQAKRDQAIAPAARKPLWKKGSK